MNCYRQVVVIGALWLATGADLPAVDFEQLDRAARAFAQRDDVQALVEDNRPQLARAYPLVVRDYFIRSADTDPLPEPRPDQVAKCARHYEMTWLQRRFVWPVTEDGTPDWRSIYIQALDHYLGFCLRQPGR